MYRILRKRHLNDLITWMEIEAPLAAGSTKAGQFAILRLDEFGERFPLTICGYDRAERTITIVFQHAGKSTKMLSLMEEGDYISDVVGPLGNPSKLDGLKCVALVGGGVGCADTYPIALELHESGAEVDMYAGFRNKDIVILEDEMRAVSTNLYITTDDGSYAEKGFITDKLKVVLESGRKYDRIITIGPAIMMKYVAETTKPFGIKTVAALNSIMVDGTGMCGGCRVTVGGEIKFTCVNGPEFDAHLVDWDELLLRTGFYRDKEEEEAEHICRLTGGVRSCH